MNKNFYILTFILILTFSCKKQKSFFEEVVTNKSYLFSSQIKDSLDQGIFPNQLAAVKSGDIGDHQNALLYWDKNLNENNFQSNKIDIDGINIRDKIVKEAINHNWLIINEQHHNSHHRVTLELLLKDLFEQGYRNLGMEQLSNDSMLNTRAYPISTSSKYYQDPQLFNVVRTALDIGYSIFPYDHNCKNSGYEREECEAQNIIQQAKISKGKTVILCGYDHGVEGEHRSWGTAMAGVLKKTMNEDVLTVNQTYLSEHSKLSFANPYYQSIDFSKAVVVDDPDSLLLPRLEKVFYPYDLYLYHAMTKYIDDRPSWLLREGYKKVQVKLPESIDLSCLVFAFNTTEKHPKATPVDIVEINTLKEYATLFIPEGQNIEYVAKDISGKTYTLELHDINNQ